MAFNHLNVPSHWEHYFTKYPQGMTILESLLEWVSQVDGMTDAVNVTLAEVQSFKDTMMPEALAAILTEWEASGKLSDVLTGAILTGKASQADLVALQATVNALTTTVNGNLSTLTATVNSRLAHLTPPATDFLTTAEKADILLDTPLLNHSASVQAYVDSQKAAGRNNLFFPKGNFRFKNVNLYNTDWNIYGEASLNGYIHDTSFNIIADATNNVGFISTARYIAFKDFGVISTGTVSDGKAISLYKNTLTNGQFITAKNIYGLNLSGVMFNTLDLIDSTFSHIHTDYCNTLVKARKAGWDRSTTVTLHKLYCIYGANIIDMPDTAQSFMTDCIFENNTLVGDISRGQWTISDTYFENNTAGLLATDAKILKIDNYYNTPADRINMTQNGVDYTHWGEAEIDTFGALFSKFSKHFEVAGNLTENNTGAAVWNKLGTWFPMGGGTRLKMEFLGAAGFTQAGGGDGFGGQTGRTTLMATFTGNSNPALPALTAFAYHEGTAKPVLKIKIVATDQYYNAFDIFVQMAANTSKVSYNLETSTGYYVKKPVNATADPGSANQNLVDVPFEFQIMTGTGTFKITTDGGIELTKPVIAGGAAPATISNYTYLAINGTYYKIPLYL